MVRLSRRDVDRPDEQHGRPGTGTAATRICRHYTRTYANRIKRGGAINAWEDPLFAQAVCHTERRNLVMGGLATDVCLVPSAISAKQEGFDAVALLYASGACTQLAEATSRRLLHKNGIATMTTTPLLNPLLGN